jgi:hypothetical protein
MYGTGNLTFNEDQHLAGYGARLIYQEVQEGYPGIVSNRQSGAGDLDLLDTRIFPNLKAFMAEVRSKMNSYNWSEGSRECLFWSPPNDPHVKFAASPQGSYGYLYLSAVVERD